MALELLDDRPAPVRLLVQDRRPTACDTLDELGNLQLALTVVAVNDEHRGGAGGRFDAPHRGVSCAGRLLVQIQATVDRCELRDLLLDGPLEYLQLDPRIRRRRQEPRNKLVLVVDG